VGCSLATSLVDLIKKIKRIHDPEFLFIEPSEMVVTQELQNVTAMGHRDVHYQIGPLITLVDALRFPFLWAERQQLIIGQINGADIVALSRTDRLEDSSPDEIRNVLRPYRNGIDLLSVHDSDSLEKMLMNVPEFTAP
jgi:G3E family GTPase